MKLNLSDIDSYILGCMNGNKTDTGRMLGLKFKEAELLNENSVDLTNEIKTAMLERVKLFRSRLDAIEARLSNEASEPEEEINITELTKKANKVTDVKEATSLAITLNGALKKIQMRRKLAKTKTTVLGQENVGSTTLVPINPKPEEDEYEQSISALHKRVCKLRSSMIKGEDTTADECGCGIYSK